LQIADVIAATIRERGPLTVAAFMELALYDPAAGYYARAAQRSGRAGDFFTSVDVGPLFGELLEVQVAEMASLLTTTAESAKHAESKKSSASFAGSAVDAIDLVEAGAGNGRLSADVLRAARRRDPLLYRAARLHLVESSAAARGAQTASLGDVADRLVSSSERLPPSFAGVLIANELIDAMPVHQVVMRDGVLQEVYVDISGGRLVTREGPLSTPALAEYFDRLAITLEPTARAEVNLNALAWIRDVAQRLERGFVILIDYGHEARELYSPTHGGGTLTTFARHTMSGSETTPPGETARTPSWLLNPGEHDITAHVDFTSVRDSAEAAGLTTLGFLDQTYFLMALADFEAFEQAEHLRRRLALKTLLMPGGLGSTHKVLILGKGVGSPRLRGCSYKARVT
jgi:SAM-dependent MidA family methyltransferase